MLRKSKVEELIGQIPSVQHDAVALGKHLYATCQSLPHLSSVPEEVTNAARQYGGVPTRSIWDIEKFAAQGLRGSQQWSRVVNSALLAYVKGPGGPHVGLEGEMMLRLVGGSEDDKYATEVLLINQAVPKLGGMPVALRFAAAIQTPRGLLYFQIARQEFLFRELKKV